LSEESLCGLRSGCFVDLLRDSLGVCGFEGLVVLCWHLQLQKMLLEFVDTPISFG
jgi:hypothetical protein